MRELIISRRRLGIGTFVCMFGLLFVLNDPDFLSVWLADHMVTSWSMLALRDGIGLCIVTYARVLWLQYEDFSQMEM